MNERSDGPLSAGLSQALEWLVRLSGRHSLITDALLAAAAAGVSTVGLGMQHRATLAMLAFCAGLCLPLLLRHRDARLCFATVALVALLQWLISGPQLADVAVLIALYWVCLLADVGSICAALLVVQAGAVMVTLSWEQHAQFKAWAAISGLGVAAAALGLMIRQRRALLRSLEEKAARLERERDQQAALGAATERARIAREMHDIVSHNLTVMIGLADGASYSLGSGTEQPAAAIERIAATGRQALLEMRRLLGVLREDPLPEPLEPQPTLERLDDLLASVQAAGVPVTAELDGDLTDLAPGQQLTIFRVVQEALTNTLKHAVRPATAHLALRRLGDMIELEVTNTGAPLRLAVPTDGRGLRGMSERAHAYGGELQAGSTGDGRWQVRLRLAAEERAL